MMYNIVRQEVVSYAKNLCKSIAGRKNTKWKNPPRACLPVAIPRRIRKHLNLTNTIFLSQLNSAPF